MNLFEENPSTLIKTENSKLILFKNFLDRDRSEFLLKKCYLDYQSEYYIINGVRVKANRRSTAIGEKEINYHYSGIDRKAQLWHKFPEIKELSLLISLFLKYETNIYNFVLCNFYENGQAAVGWHSDDESIINQKIPISSISIGQSRTFEVRKIGKLEDTLVSVLLEDGDLLIMEGDFQREFQHRLKKDNSKHPRINFTFRCLENSSG